MSNVRKNKTKLLISLKYRTFNVCGVLQMNLILAFFFGMTDEQVPMALQSAVQG